MIRDILMGQQMAEYNKKFDEVEGKMGEMNSDISGKIKAMEKDMDSRLKSIEKDMNARFDKLENLLRTHVDDLNGKLSRTSKSDKENLGRMLQEMGKRLLEK